jgi:hypothetical protein
MTDIDHKAPPELNPVRKNYDYGEGLYSGMFKYKSVEDFLKARKEKKKKYSLAESVDLFYKLAQKIAK